MSKINISKETDAIFGNCIKIENGLVELLVTIDYGPRIISFSLNGKENMLYQDKKKTSMGELYKCYDGDIIKLYGGHRIWASPEVVPRCYYPDNNPVEYKEIENGAVFTAPIEKVNNIQKSMRITLQEELPVVKIDNIIKNCNAWNIQFAPWCVTMLDGGGVEVIPQPDRKTGYLPNRNISLWPYSKMNDNRIYWGDRFITITQDEQADTPFKMGLNNEAGWIAYFNKGQVFFKFIDPEIEGNYPDNGCCYETYTDNVMCECETLGTFVDLQPGKEAVLTEEWEIYEQDFVPKKDEEEIKNVIKNYIDL